MATLTDREIATYAAQAGFKGTDLTTAVAVAIGESSGRTAVVGAPFTTVGLWQINVSALKSEHPLWSVGWLQNPANNAKAAFTLWRQRKWVPWTVYTSGKYREFWKRAQAATANVSGTVTSRSYSYPVVAASSGKYARNAAYELGPMFGIKTIGTYPGHDQGISRSLDFMINNVADGTKVGDQLADYARKNWKRLGVAYIVWNRKIWNITRDSEGWRDYHGTPNPHTDHVHITFRAPNDTWEGKSYPAPGPWNDLRAKGSAIGATAGFGLGNPAGGTGIAPLDNTAAALGSIVWYLKRLDEIAAMLQDPLLWRRVAFIVAGIVCILLGIVSASKGEVGKVVKLATDVVPVGKVAKVAGKVAS